MLFISHRELQKRLNENLGKLEVLCIEAPITVPNGVAGEWHIFFVPSGTEDRIPLITSGANPRIRVLKKLHGLFMLLVSFGFSPVCIPIEPNQSCFFEANSSSS